jgi:hypothetical protein
VPNLTYRSHDDLIAGWPTPWKVGLLTAAPNPDGTGVLEPNPADGYARQAFTYDKAQLDGITTVTNNVNIVFGPATNPWTPVNYFGLFDANGVLRMYGRLRTQRSVPTGNAETFVAGKIAARLR